MTMGDLSESTARHGLWKIQAEFVNCLKVLGLERVCRGLVGLVRETHAVFRPQETPMRHDIEDAPLAHAGTDTIRVDTMAVKCVDIRETDATVKIVFASVLAKNHRMRAVVTLCSSTSLMVSYASQCQSSSVMFVNAALRGPFETEWRKNQPW